MNDDDVPRLAKRARLEAGELSWEIDGLREKAERGEL